MKKHNIKKKEKMTEKKKDQLSNYVFSPIYLLL